ncbi:MAG: class I SAM-dependent methyltransferase [Dokdonella sp.]
MQEAEFDKFADEYHAQHVASIGASGEGPEFFARYKIQDLVWEQSKRTRSTSVPLAIVDFGAGVGGSVPHLKARFAQSSLTCVDVSQRSLELASSRFPGQADFRVFDGQQLPLDTASQDIVFAACVFHHIAHSEHVKLLSEWRRVLRPGGIAMVYEHNPYNPMTRRVVDSCAFDANAHLITARQMRRQFSQAGFVDSAVRYRVFFPHFMRALRRWERCLAPVPLGAQYYVVATRQ